MLLRSDDRVDLIRATPLFENLSRRELAHVAGIADERDVEQGAELIHEGEPGDTFFAIVDGEIEVTRAGTHLARLGAGSFVGEIALLSQSPRTATVTALTPLKVLALADDDFIELLDNIPELWLKVARALAERIEVDEAFAAAETAG